MKADFDIDVKWFGKTASEKVFAAAMKGLKQGGEVVAGEGQELAPRLSGTLARSICVTEGGTPDLEQMHEKAIREKSRKKPIIVQDAVGEEVAVYVTANTPYAHKQHEHNKNHSKFLENALQNETDTIQKLVERQLKQL